MAASHSPVPPELIGREVSVRAVLPLWEAIRRRGFDPALLAEGTGCSIAVLTDPRERIPWTALHRLLSNMGAIVGDDAEIVAIGCEIVDSPFLRALMLPGRYLFGVTDIYRWICGPSSPSVKAFAQAYGECVELGAGHIRFSLWHRHGYETSHENFLLMKGVLIALGTAVAGERADVSMREHTTGAHYDIALRDRRGLLHLARPYLKPAVDWIERRRSLQRAHHQLYARYADLEREVNTRIVVENELRRSEARYHDLFDRGPLPAWVFEAGTLKFLDVNAAAIRHYGYSRDEFLAMTLLDIRPADEVPALLELVKYGTGRTRTWRHRKRDGTVILVEITTHSVLHEDRDARLVVANDVTARHHLEDQLRNAQKMEAVGHLAGGIAHDFNNLLGVIINASELRLRDMELSETARHDLQTILAAAERGAELTRRLLSFSRRQLFTRKLLDVGEVLREMQPLLARAATDRVQVAVCAPRSIGVTCVDRESLERVVMNLVVNARDAIRDGGGTVTIQASLVELDVATAHAHGVAATGVYAVIAVTDDGRGIDDATRARMFEPYFTTKPRGQGTGLGLATVMAIVEQSGGHIRVESELGRGARFEIYFPIEAVVENDPAIELRRVD